MKSFMNKILFAAMASLVVLIFSGGTTVGGQQNYGAGNVHKPLVEKIILQADGACPPPILPGRPTPKVAAS